MKVDHIGYLCKDIKKSIELFLALGYEQESEVYEDNVSDGDSKPRNVYICFLRNEGTRIELVSPIDEASDVYSTLKRQGEGPYHVCYQVQNLEDSIQELKTSGWMVLKRPAKAMAFRYRQVAFLFKTGAGTIELVEMKG
ncbi:VOC family protein [Ruminococcus sp.]|jgi:methylmalonyl-CoA/ethylmalonyl-CoA epimerase|uniref:VOC family protein n=1 Tax=Ruminococcus sp. TaxID=41978 RepID=UPI0025F1416B|nr:VOC family protein [Ruminococcus sp.]